MGDFMSLGISENSFPKLKKYSGKCLIVGSSRAVFDDLDAFLGHDDHYYHEWGDVMCVNDMIMHYPGKVTHAYSNDHNRLSEWVSARRPRYVKDFSNAILSHTCQCGEGFVWPWPGHGTSGLNACYTALALGYEEIVLAGIPLDNSGHYFEPLWKTMNFIQQTKPTDDGPKFWASAAKNIFAGRVKSLSGRTKQLLGE